jgi:dimethylhistidine N-methyltransferase
MVYQSEAAQTGSNSFAEDVRKGLSATPKVLLPKYFYDALGSQLFEAICLLPEYYPTRAESEIFTRYAAEIIRELLSPITLSELGSGSSVKTRLLIEAILARQTQLHYQPMDISASILELSAEKLLADYPKLRISGHVCDYTQCLGEIERSGTERVLALFLGSNIGNYTPQAARQLLGQIRSALQPGDALLLGADLKKSRAVLEAAYDDPLGVTAAFNLNVLARINRELSGNFDLRQFRHRAVFNEEKSRVEMHLVSTVAQTVEIRGLAMTLQFQPGETIHTENSYKYDLDMLAELATARGFATAKTWFDAERRFSCNLWMAA